MGREEIRDLRRGSTRSASTTTRRSERSVADHDSRMIFFAVLIAFIAGGAVQKATDFWSGVVHRAKDTASDIMYLFHKSPEPVPEWPPASFAKEYARTNKAAAAYDELKKDLLENWKELEPYTLLAGDEQGVKFAVTGGDHRQLATFPCQGYQVYSASKLIVAAAIGHAVVSKDNDLSWDTKASDVFDWWHAKHGQIWSSDDPRADLTLERFLSQTTGVELSKVLKSSPTVQEEFSNHGPAMTDPAYAAPFIFDKAINTTHASNHNFHYDRGNFVIAAAMAMNVTGFTSWPRFVEKYFAQPLGLIRQPMARTWLLDKVYPMMAVKQQEDIGFQSRVYGHLRTTDGFSYPVIPPYSHEWFQYALAMTPGSHFMMSATAYSIFLTKYVSGEYDCDKHKLETWVTDAADGKVNTGALSWGKHQGYGLGQWVMRDYPSSKYRSVTHSGGVMGALPVVGETASGQKFWFYVGRFGSGKPRFGTCTLTQSHKTGKWEDCENDRSLLHPDHGIVDKVSKFMETAGKKIKPIPQEKLCQPRKPRVGCCKDCMMEFSLNGGVGKIPKDVIPTSPRCSDLDTKDEL